MTDHRPEVRVKVYEIIRDEDVSGISGTGRVGDVAVFPNGKVVVAWDTPQRISTVVIYDSLEDAQKIHGHSGKTRFVPPAPPIEPVGVREALEEALAIANEPDGPVNHLTVYLRERETRIVNWKRKAQAALAASEQPVVEEVVTVLAVRDHNWGCGFDAEDMPGKIKLCAYSTTKVNEGDRVRVVVYKEE